VLTPHDLRELLLLTALGVVLGLVHLVLRPGLPVVAEPAAACTLDEPLPALTPEPLASTPEPPMSSMPPEAAP
jgi:hypothetical protein